MPIDPELESSLAQFRLDIIKALTDIDIEINALQQALETEKLVTPERLKELRKQSRVMVGHKLRDYHSQHISPAHVVVPPKDPL